MTVLIFSSSLFLVASFFAADVRSPHLPQTGGESTTSGGPPQQGTSNQAVQDSLNLVDWYRQHYDFISLEDTIFTFESEFEIPEGYRRPDSAELSLFQNWVSHFPLWHRWKPVGIWKGGKAYERDQISRVVHLPWKGRNFRDCAIPLRILAEFLRYRQREFEMQIIPRLGDTLRYEEWLRSKAVYGGRGEVLIQPDDPREPSPYEYYRFLDFGMKNTTYKSLAANCDSIPESLAAPGDLFVAHNEDATTGCAYVIMNMLVNDANEKLYVVATGCPEACDFHIPLFNENRHNPWITIEHIRILAADLPYAGFFRFKVQ
ncbi:MAG: DUF4846 domain-containing protein [Candidatus Zixiibacteriota bacterium]